jgi:hypothetical protein
MRGDERTQDEMFSCMTLEQVCRGSFVAGDAAADGWLKRTGTLGPLSCADRQGGLGLRLQLRRA